MTLIRSGQGLWQAGCSVAALLCATAAAQAQTAPGTGITNQAEVRYTIGGVEQRGTSTVATLIVAERLDVAVGGDDAPTTILPQPTPVAATVTNTGSGHEAFAIAASPSSGLRVDLVAIDRDGDGRFDAGVDQQLAGVTPVLAPGETVRLVALVEPVAAPVDGTLVIEARARTGSGTVGRMLPGLGDDGVDAVIGRTGAVASTTRPLVAAAATAPRLVKSQAVRAPDGSTSPVSGAIVTYTLVATLPAGSATGARIEDPVPAGTGYVAGSLTLDGDRLTDAADADAGDCDGRLVAVALGDRPAAAATHTVTFQVRLP